jgi:hypothetical protein
MGSATCQTPDKGAPGRRPDRSRVVVYKRPREYRATYYARADSDAGAFAAVSQLTGLAASGPKFLYVWWP